jgi:hypothetical protein
MKKLLEPLSKGDYCALEILLDHETKFLKEEKEGNTNKDWHSICDAHIQQCERLKKTLWTLSEWDR